MQSWFKYALSFFALVLLLSGFIYVLGPSSTRQAARSGESPVGQLSPNSTLTSVGEAPTTASGTTQPPATIDSATVETSSDVKSKDGNQVDEKTGQVKETAKDQ
jgi:uncharacterized protein YjeT (DUF2065 family)